MVMQSRSNMCSLLLMILISIIPHIQGQVRFNQGTCQAMTCNGAHTECYDDNGNIPGVCRCLVGYISEAEVTTETDCSVCKTFPSNLDGSCVPINECPDLNNLLTAARQRQTSALERLRGSVCKSNRGNGQLNVCCPPQSEPRCGGNNGTERIVGGENAPLTQWPWMALLRASGGDFRGWICGGVLISSRYVLTAAHCVVGTPYKLDFVRLGELVLNDDPDGNGELTAPSPQDITVEESDIISHKQFNSPCRRCNDIALIRLSTPARLDNLFVQPICISRYPARAEGVSASNFINLNAWVAGWGATSTDPYVFSNPQHLQQLQVPIQELKFCKQLKLEFPDPDMIFCAGSGTFAKDTCRGDSGGPLMLASPDQSWYAIGIVSFGSSICGAEGSQTVFTNVSYYLPWIEKNLK